MEGWEDRIICGDVRYRQKLDTQGVVLNIRKAMSNTRLRKLKHERFHALSETLHLSPSRGYILHTALTGAESLP